jgi:hypothetical protein
VRKLASFVAMPLALAVFAAAAAPALGAPCPPDTNCPPPTVTTLPATNVTDTTAMLNGTVNGNGAAVTYVFAYGTSATYGSFSSPPGILAPSTTPQSAAATITGLQPATTYHFRLTASSNTAPGVGADMTFTTKPRVRKQPRLSLRVRPTRDRSLPYKFTSTGTLTRPTGVSRSDGCAGTVSVQVKSGTKTISTRRVKVRSNCTYKSSVTFKSRGRLKARGTLKVTARYGGNQFLKSATAKSARVRYGA